MSLAVVGEASLIECLYGLSPTPLIVLPYRTVMVEGMLMGNITDFTPLANIMTFGECVSLANPEVLSATIAAAGVLTPMPCIPVTINPWTSDTLNVMVQGSPALDQEATLMCTWGGVISVEEPGNYSVTVP